MSNLVLFLQENLYADNRMLNIRLNILASNFERVADSQIQAKLTVD